LLGATAGRTTLQGEGLQHNDGHSHVLFSVVPNVRAYDPAFAYELAVIIRDGLKAMVERQEDVFYYLTLYNENYEMPAMPEGVAEGIVRGMYLLRRAVDGLPVKAQLLGSGTTLRETLRAADILAERFGVGADVWSVTSYQQLRADALAAERWNRLHPTEPARVPYLTQRLAGTSGPVIAASEYMKLVPDMVARFVPQGLTPLGTDGYGLSDTRTALRRHFEVDAENIAVATLAALARTGAVPSDLVTSAIIGFGLDPDRPDPASR
jgi:pyruvate dehydrogenase E1 component